MRARRSRATETRPRGDRARGRVLLCTLGGDRPSELQHRVRERGPDRPLLGGRGGRCRNTGCQARGVVRAHPQPRPGGHLHRVLRSGGPHPSRPARHAQRSSEYRPPRDVSSRRRHLRAVCPARGEANRPGPAPGAGGGIDAGHPVELRMPAAPARSAEEIRKLPVADSLQRPLAAIRARSDEQTQRRCVCVLHCSDTGPASCRRPEAKVPQPLPVRMP